MGFASIPELFVKNVLIVCGLDKNLPVFHFDFVRGCWFRGGHSQSFARAHVEFGTVTWANEAEVVECAFAEWTSIVRAFVVYAVDFILDSNQDHKSVVDLKAKLVGLREVGKQGNRDEVAHSNSSVRVRVGCELLSFRSE